VRVDTFPEVLPKLRDCEFRVTVRAGEELRVLIHVEEGRLVGYHVESDAVSLVSPAQLVIVALDKILEVAFSRKLFTLARGTSLTLGVALWEGGLPMDVLPAESWLDVQLGTEAFAWPEG
jgi:hypothetical protein